MVALKGISLSSLSLSRSSTPTTQDSPRSSKPTTPTSGGATTPPTRPTTTEADITDGKKNGLGLGASIRRSTSFRTPASPGPTPTSSVKPSKELVRPSSDTTTGLQPLRHSTTPHGAPVIGRRITSNTPSPLVASTTTPVLGKTHSQPGLSRLPVSAANGLKSLLPSSSTSTSKAPTILSGASTPLLTSGSKLPAGANILDNLSESFIEKVSLRLGEGVNRVFLPGVPGAPGTEEAVVLNGRSAPNRIRAREFGDMVVHELHTSLHDIYLLRTILRSSVLKSLSLFLSRITALLLPPSASTPFLPPLTPKEVDTLPIPTRFNLAIVRSAYEMKTALKRAGADGAPPIVEETLRPWVGKLEELMARVMGPLVEVLRKEVARICAKARIAEVGTALSPVVSNGVQVGGAPLSTNSSSTSINAPSASEKTMTSAPASHSLALPGAASLRSLSLGRTASNASGHAASTNNAAVGPSWIKELVIVLEATTKFFKRMECGRDADKWVVGVGTCVAWKGMLALSARNVVAGDEMTMTSAVGEPAGTEKEKEKAKGGLFKSAKKSPSPPNSPLLFPVGASAANTNGGSSPPLNGGAKSASATPASDIAFIRLLCELELFETRLSQFVTCSLTITSLPPPHHHHRTTSSVTPSPPSPDCPCSATTCPSTINSASPFCGLCKTGRTFDGESSSDSDDSDDEDAEERAAGLAQYAMREAMQALSAMILVLRASAIKGKLEEALGWEKNLRIGKREIEQMEKQRERERREKEKVILTPAMMLAATTTKNHVIDTPPAPSTLSPLTVAKPCPTLLAALDTLPTLLLLHVVASRLPRSLNFQLPHELWGLEWNAYEAELKGFRAAEEWKLEIGWEMMGQCGVVRKRLGSDETLKEKGVVHDVGERLDLLELVVESKIGLEGEE